MNIMRPGLVFFLMAATIEMNAQKNFPLYDGPIPNSRKSPNEEITEQRDGITIISKISIPSITVFQAPAGKANGTAVIIFPGGGYWVNAHGHEGIDVAKRFNEMGVTAFVVKYRIPDDKTMQNREIGPLQDAQQAIHLVRERAAEWNVKSNRIGIMGFSAGGHLASTLGTHYEKPVIENVGTASLRPDFMILIYPVISFVDSVGHMGSREQLIGKEPADDKILYYSNELQVNEKTPPSFLVHASDDDAVKSENSIRFYQALVRNKVGAELHLYERGGHGFGMTNKTTNDQWMDRCFNWLQSNGWLKK
jgi:acetyl esterase/lipase